MKEIASAIREAQTPLFVTNTRFLPHRAGGGFVLAFVHMTAAVAFVFGTIMSGSADWFGMKIAT
jgi:Na+/H+-translocating membrane pyrophosphatase